MVQAGNILREMTENQNAWRRLFRQSAERRQYKVSDLPTLERITLDSNGGNVEFEKIAVEESLDVTAKNGNISGTIIGGWDDFSISCDIKKGESNLPESKTGGEKSLTANCNNGDIYITFMAE